MHQTSTYKILLLLNFLFQKSMTKNEIVAEFKKHNFNINKPTINRYLKILEQNGFRVECEKRKKENVYTLEQKYSLLRFSESELNALDEVKKVLFLQKDYNKIRLFLRLFCKFALFVTDNDVKERLFNFGYYSGINWYVIRKLDEHCKTKDIVQIEYISPYEGVKTLTVHVDYFKIANNKDRLYLRCIIGNGTDFSNLPADRIYRIKKVLRRKVMFNINAQTLTYVVSKDVYQRSLPDENESVIKSDDKYVYISRLKDDNFRVIQRLLYFCPDLYYISDENVKKQVKEKLEIMKGMYEKELDA